MNYKSICQMNGFIIDFGVHQLMTLFATQCIHWFPVIMITSSNGNISRITCPLCGEFTGPGQFQHKGQWRGALIFSLICAWINGWVNYREAGDSRRHRGHYDVIVMILYCSQGLEHGDVLRSKHPVHYWQFVGWLLTGNQWIPLTKGQWIQYLLFCLSSSCWTNIRSLWFETS